MKDGKGALKLVSVLPGAGCRIFNPDLAMDAALLPSQIAGAWLEFVLARGWALRGPWKNRRELRRRER